MKTRVAADVRSELRDLITDHPNLHSPYTSAYGDAGVLIRTNEGDAEIFLYEKKGKIKCAIYGEEEDFKPDALIYRTKDNYSCTFNVRPAKGESSKSIAVKILEWAASVHKFLGDNVKDLVTKKTYSLGGVSPQPTNPRYATDIYKLTVISDKGLDAPGSELTVIGELCLDKAQSYEKKIVEFDIEHDRILEDGEEVRLINHREVMDAVIKAIREYEIPKSG